MIASLDHIVLTTTDLSRCIRFYVDVLGMRLETFGEGRTAFVFGSQKINVHVKGAEFTPHAHLPVSGSLDLCFLTDMPLEKVMKRLSSMGQPLLEGPVARTGAQGPLRSIYLRDPDLNLIEISEPAESVSL